MLSGSLLCDLQLCRCLAETVLAIVEALMLDTCVCVRVSSLRKLVQTVLGVLVHHHKIIHCWPHAIAALRLSGHLALDLSS